MALSAVWWRWRCYCRGISVTIRRLHDLDRTGWWLLIALTGIGMILLIVWYCMKGTTGPNSYGPDPLGG